MRLAVLVLAAGRSTRYRAAGGPEASKLVAPFAGHPLVWHAVQAAAAWPALVVTGHARADVEAALAGEPVRFVHNAAFADGLAGSLRCGLAALEPDVEAAVVMLGDMPLVAPATIATLVAAAQANPAADAVVPVTAGQRGNPVLLRRSLFAAAARLTGDEGARRLLRDPAVRIIEVAVEGEGVRFDVDAPDALAAGRR